MTPWTVARQAPLSMGILQVGILEGVAMPFSRGSSQHRTPTLQADSLPSEPPGKPKNNRVGSLSLLQGIFPTQESNQGLLHCRWILYQLSYQGSPLNMYMDLNLYLNACITRHFAFVEMNKKGIFFLTYWMSFKIRYIQSEEIVIINKRFADRRK